MVITSGEDLPLGCFPVPDDFPLAKAALQLVWSSLGTYNYPGDTLGLGSCFMVAPGVVATATHTVDWAKRRLERDGVRHPTGELRLNLGVVERGTGLSMRVVRSTTFGESEITFLEVDRHETLANCQLPQPLTLRTSRLRADEALYLVGFAEQEVELDDEETKKRGENVVHVQAKAIVGRGFVRDEQNEFLIHSSTIHVDGVEVLPGMSGGPVFDEANRVVGLISRSMEKGGYSIVSRWTEAFSTESFAREHVGPVMISDSGGGSFMLQIHNAD